jgi:hypothetical protein
VKPGTAELQLGTESVAIAKAAELEFGAPRKSTESPLTFG